MSTEQLADEEIAKTIKEEIKRMTRWMVEKIPELINQQLIEVVKAILATQDEKQNNLKTVFVFGLGRSGLDAKGFAMRLEHLGFDVRVLDETTVPAFEKGDLFIVVSGSGASLKSQIEIALDIGAKIIVVTSFPNSVGAKLADIKLVIPGRGEEDGASLGYHERQMRGIPIFPLGTDFEDFAMIILDAIVAGIIFIKKKTEGDLKKQHANVPER